LIMRHRLRDWQHWLAVNPAI